ncbi:MAG: toll/interleukin-1 receptor domain-containing protein [Candidatus Binatia bacterium]
MIFVSYSRHDQAVCDEIVRALEEHGHEVWIDRKAIRGGDVWRATIEKAIKLADTFLLLLSPRVSEYIQGELELAHSHRKKIIAVRLKPQQELPEGYDLILSGRQQIELVDFDRGIRQLLEALGNPGRQPAVPTSLWGKAVRKAQRVRARVAQHEVGPTVVKLGAAALAGAAAVVATMAAVQEERRKNALQNYRVAVENLLERCTTELALTADMTTADYVREFCPRMQRLLGQFEATPAPTDELARQHADLVANLQRTVDEYDQAIARIECGDVGSFRRAVARVVAAFSETLRSHKLLLDSIA